VSGGSVPKSIDSPEEARLPERVLVWLADLAKVPNDERELFFENIREAVQTTWEQRDIMKGGPTKAKIEALEQTASSLYKLVRNLDSNEREFIKTFLGKRDFAFGRISGEGGLLQTAYEIAHLFSVLTGNPSPPYPHQPPPAARRGKPQGSVKDRAFQDFVFQLDLYASLAGGRLTLEKNIGAGTLLKAIDILARHLPDDVVPEKPLSTTTLQRIKALVRTTIKQEAELK
jgi:hypothetical protein